MKKILWCAMWMALFFNDVRAVSNDDLCIPCYLKEQACRVYQWLGAATDAIKEQSAQLFFSDEKNEQVPIGQHPLTGAGATHGTGKELLAQTFLEGYQRELAVFVVGIAAGFGRKALMATARRSAQWCKDNAPNVVAFALVGGVVGYLFQEELVRLGVAAQQGLRYVDREILHHPQSVPVAKQVLQISALLAAGALGGIALKKLWTKTSCACRALKEAIDHRINGTIEFHEAA